jgi:hypothetical protein
LRKLLGLSTISCIKKHRDYPLLAEKTIEAELAINSLKPNFWQFFNHDSALDRRDTSEAIG